MGSQIIGDGGWWLEELFLKHRWVSLQFYQNKSLIKELLSKRQLMRLEQVNSPEAYIQYWSSRAFQDICGLQVPFRRRHTQSQPRGIRT